MLVDRLEAELGVPRVAVDNLINSSSHQYKVYNIRKRSGGYRRIEQPSKRLKFLQRWLIHNVFSYFPVSSAATAYVKGRNLVANVSPHKHNYCILKMDFVNFFPSLSSGDVLALVKRNHQSVPFSLSERDMRVIVQVVSRFGRLTIGAPTSPIISNCLLYDLDQYILGVCSAEGAVFTRYADDITVSARNFQTLERVYAAIQSYLEANRQPSLSINTDKTVFVSKKYKRWITGLIITSDGKVSIGREKKRMIRAMLHHFVSEDISICELEKLRGWIAYSNDVEPSFTASLAVKYGPESIERLLKRHE